ncbi:MAG: hypothetical protein WC674_05200 [Candidatus Krumholzibacteriia bacterium]
MRSPLSSRSSSLKLLSCLLILGLGLYFSCGEKKQSAPQKASPSYDLAGEWHSDIASADRQISKSIYTIEQKGDSVALELISTKSPSGGELVPDGMRFEAKGIWRENALRFEALSWISGRDTCTYQVRGDMDKEGRLLLHFPADLCGEKSLAFTRALYRPVAIQD